LEIETSARLHLSLIDLNGLEGRLDGGIGISLEKPSLRIKCKPSNDDTNIFFDKSLRISSKKVYESKIIDATNKMNQYLKTDKNYSFEVKDIYPIHHGLGLGTQLSLSIAKLISSLNNVDLSVFDLAKIIERGGASGIGVHSFDKGGLIIDGGHKKSLKKDYLPSSASNVSPPPLLARYDFPEDWDIIIATPDMSQGVSGQSEVNIFQKYSPIEITEVERICYLTLMKLMPSIIEKDIESFGDAVNKIQSLGFKKIETELQNSKVHSIINTMHDLDIPCVGMSSFGPTCFGIVDSNSINLTRELSQLIGNDVNIFVTKGKNHGFLMTEGE
jgi:beta-ribofuranosylaminobenzene 5'-phosphate synthase